MTDPKSTGPAAGDRVTCVIDLGRHGHERVRRLRRGEGRLMLDVENVVDDLKGQGVLTPGAETVVVVVRETVGMADLIRGGEDDDLDHDDDEDLDDEDDDDD